MYFVLYKLAQFPSEIMLKGVDGLMQGLTKKYIGQILLIYIERVDIGVEYIK